MSLLFPYPSTKPYVIISGDRQWEIYGHAAVLAANSSEFPPILTASYYTVRVPYLKPRPFLWVWYLLNSMAPPEPLRHLEEIMEAYKYLSLFAFSNLKLWWKLITDERAIFPTYLSVDSGSYREELRSILARAKGNDLPLPTSHLTSFDRSYLGLYPPEERKDINIPSLSPLMVISNLNDVDNRTTVIIGIVGDNPRIEQGEIGDFTYEDVSDRPLGLSSLVKGEILRLLDLEGSVMMVNIPDTKESWTYINGNAFRITEDTLLREQSPLTFYKSPRPGESLREMVALSRSRPRPIAKIQKISLAMAEQNCTGNTEPLPKCFSIANAIWWGQPLVMRENSTLLASLDDLFSPHETVLFREYTVRDLPALRYTWACLNDLEAPPPETITSWLALWECLSYFGVPLTSSIINRVLDLLIRYTPSTDEKALLLRILTQIPPSIRQELDVFRWNDGNGSIADRVTGTILTTGFSDMKEVTVAEIKTGGDSPTKYWAVLWDDDDGTMCYHQICTIKRGKNAIMIDGIISYGASWLTTVDIGGIEALRVVRITFLHEK